MFYDFGVDTLLLCSRSIEKYYSLYSIVLSIVFYGFGVEVVCVCLVKKCWPIESLGIS